MMHPNVRTSLYFLVHAIKSDHWRAEAEWLMRTVADKRAELAYEKCGEQLLGDRHAECVCGEHAFREHDDQDWRDEKADRSVQ